MCIFNTDHLVLDNQFMCSCLGKTVSHSLNISKLLAVFWCGVEAS